MNCVLYARVSTSEQAELSIPAQLQAMRDYAHQHGWTVVEEFVEPGASARTAERPALQRLLAAVRNEAPKLDVVLVHKIDRLARNVYDHATIRALLKQRGTRLASVVENVDDSVSGQLVENIMASIAQFYSANLGEEVKKGMRQKVLKGGWPHLPPRGYIQAKTGDEGESRIEVHSEHGPLMRKAFELYATGWYSMKAIAAMLAKEGLTTRRGGPLAGQYLRDLLSNPFYIGRLRWKDIEVAAAHQPLVSPELFEQVKGVMRRRFRDPGAKGRTNGFPLRGVAICASCRGHMTAGWQRSGWNARRWGYYRCSRRIYDKARCGGIYGSRADKAHDAVGSICKTLQLTAPLVESILAAAHRLLKERATDAAARVNSATMKRVKLREKEMRLTELFLAGDVSPEAYRASGAKLRKEVNRNESELTELQKDPVTTMRRIESMLGQAQTIGALHQQLDETQRVKLVRAVFETIVLDETGIVGFTLRPPFDSIFRHGDRPNADSIANELVTSADNLGSPAA